MLTLILGAVGAIFAIYLKEAAQSAIQRRIIAYQLSGYLMWWKARIVKSGPAFLIYQEVQKREAALKESATKGTEAFRKQYEHQNATQADARTLITAEVSKMIESRQDVKTNALTMKIVDEAVAFSALQRSYLVDSKTFISDKDAAILGKRFAINVVQFRVSMVYTMVAIEGLIKTACIDGEDVENRNFSKIATGLIDSIIVSGEELIIAMIRLERNVDALTKKSLLQLTIDVLLGR